ncbi:MAG: autotransporter domain-containing protein [Alphaproteobacteria bacterium]
MPILGANRYAMAASIFVFSCLLHGHVAFAENLVSNNGFENGYSGFTSDYTSSEGLTCGGSNCLDQEGWYAVGDDPGDYRSDSNFDGTSAHSGTEFFMSNGGSTTTSSVWRSRNLVSVTQAFVQYRFEAYIASLVTVYIHNEPGPDLEFEIGDGTNWLALGASAEFFDEDPKGVWKFSFQDREFTTAGNYFIRLRNDQSAAAGNDFAIDDIYFGLAADAPSAGSNPPSGNSTIKTESLTVIPNIDTDQAQYTTNDLTNNSVGPAFEGGTLQASGSTSLDNVFTVLSSNGTVDTNNFNLSLSGNISGSGGLTKAGAGVLTFDANTVDLGGGLQIEAGELALNGASLTNGAAIAVDNGATLSGTGTITGDVTVSGTLSPGNSPGTLTVAGSVTQAADSTFNVDIDGTGTGDGAGNYDRLILTGSSSVFTANGTLAPILRGISSPANNTFSPSVGDTFTIVEAEGGVNGTFTTLTQPSSGLASGRQLDVIYNSTSIALMVNPSSYNTLVSGDGLLNAQAASAAFDQFRSTDLLLGLDGLSQTEMDTAFQQLSGDINATIINGARASNRLMREGVLARMSHPQSIPQQHNAAQQYLQFTSSIAPAQDHVAKSTGKVAKLARDMQNVLDDDPKQSLWINVSGEKLKVEADASSLASDTYTMAIYGGADLFETNHMKGGIGIGYSGSRVDTDFGSEGKTDSYQVFGYGGLSYKHAYLYGTVGYSYDSQSTSRTVDLSTSDARANGKTNGYTVSGDIEAGYHIPFENMPITFTPNARLRMEYISRDSFTETGDSRIRLTQDSFNGSSGQIAVGANLYYQLNIEGKETVLFGFGNHMLYDIGRDRSIAVTNSLGGQDFEVNAARDHKISYQTSLSADYKASESVKLSLKGMATINAESIRQQIVASIKYFW